MNDILNYLFEVGNLQRVSNSGWWLIGEKNPNSVAEHVFRASTIAYFLAHLENSDPHKASSIALFHDNQESRLTDLHKLAQRYVNHKEADLEVLREQLYKLPEKIRDDVQTLFKEYNTQSTPEGIIAKDADLLEYGLKARELIVQGNTGAKNWLDNVNKLVRTDTGKKLAKLLYTADPNDWWKGLKKIER